MRYHWSDKNPGINVFPHESESILVKSKETKTAIHLLNNLNEPIKKVNEKYPPLYVRNRDKTIANTYENFVGKTVAKSAPCRTVIPGYVAQ